MNGTTRELVCVAVVNLAKVKSVSFHIELINVIRGTNRCCASIIVMNFP
jgi:hypothetical protein